VAVLAAVAAAGLLALLIIDNDGGASRIDLPGIAENGSIRATEHRDELSRQAASQTVAEQGSIRAVEHRDELSREAASPTEVSQEYVEQLVARR
jgi:hypothetical protein